MEQGEVWVWRTDSAAGGALSARGWQAAPPLWRRAPTRDRDGRLCTDFMMIAPALKRGSTARVVGVCREVEWVLLRYGERVLFADFNMNLKLLWVSLISQPGLMSEVIAALRARAPELKLVAQQPIREDMR